MPLSIQEKDLILAIAGKYDHGFDCGHESKNKDFVECKKYKKSHFHHILPSICNNIDPSHRKVSCINMTNMIEKSDICNLKTDYKCNLPFCKELIKMNLNAMKYHLQFCHKKNIIPVPNNQSIRIAYRGVNRNEYFEKDEELYTFFANANDQNISFGVSSIGNKSMHVNNEVTLMFQCDGKIKMTTEWTNLTDSNGIHLVKFTKENFFKMCNNSTTCLIAIVFCGL